MIVFNHTRAAPKLDALTSRRVKQEQKRAIVFRQVGERDVLPVAAVVGKAERLVVDNFNKSLWPTSVLKIGRAVCGRGGEESGILFGNKFCELGRDPIGESISHAPLVCSCRATLGLRLLRCRSEDPAGIIHATIAA